MKLSRIGLGRSGVASDHDTPALPRVQDIEKIGESEAESGILRRVLFAGGFTT
jgi:hypothetical protein